MDYNTTITLSSCSDYDSSSMYSDESVINDFFFGDTLCFKNKQIFKYLLIYFKYKIGAFSWIQLIAFCDNDIAN